MGSLGLGGGGESLKNGVAGTHIGELLFDTKVAMI